MVTLESILAVLQRLFKCVSGVPRKVKGNTEIWVMRISCFCSCETLTYLSLTTLENILTEI